MDFVARNVEIMNSLEGFSVVIVCCSSQLQADYWQKRLELGKGCILSPSSVVLAVEEDWPGGAGNALGTLYAYQNAAKLAATKFGLDLNAELRANRISVGLYHTAGKGTRLAPLPAAENNNKPGVKLPASVTLSNGACVPITILESVIKQTGCYALSRTGRLSVFWGDQVFIPTAPVVYTITHHVDILCSLGPMLNEADWVTKGMDKYGLIAQNAAGGAAQVEKVSHATAVQLLASLGEITSVGASLGSFSVSNQILFALLEEFADELLKREGKLDSDPHLWMPMTLEKAAYLQLMEQKGITGEFPSVHYDRIQAMITRFLAIEENRRLGIFGPVDVGSNICWWDYGQLKLYQKFNILATESSEEAALMRNFFGLSNSIQNSQVVNTTVSEGSCVTNSSIGAEGKPTGSVKKSMLCNVKCNYIEADNCILINVTADRIVAQPGSIIYNIADVTKNGLDVAAGDVNAGVFNESGECMKVISSLGIDGGKVWKERVANNRFSFEEIYDNNMTANPTVIEEVIGRVHESTWNDLKS